MKADLPNEAGMALLEVVQNQIDSNDPPKVRETYDRLKTLEIDREDALKYIACALSVEVFDVINNSEPFDAERYNRNLDSLPEMPWEDVE